ncbi:MAG: hypothetical protein NVS4B13_01520 [Candidatus Elarobacter sp.]
MTGSADAVRFGAVTPVVPAPDVRASIRFYVEKLGFTELFGGDENGMVRRDDATVMFFACAKPEIAAWTAFRIRIDPIDSLYARCLPEGIVHPDGMLALRPWGNREFTVLDPSGVGITFWGPA